MSLNFKMVFRGQFFDNLHHQAKLLSGAGKGVGAPSFALFAKGGMRQQAVTAVTNVTTRNTNRQ
jgi:hypothetical protein